MSNKIVIIRNAAKSDFGGGEKVPVLIAKKVSENSRLETIVLSRSEKLLAFAENQSVNHMKSWWWSRQNWSGLRILLTPLYIVWQILLFVYYIIVFVKLQPYVIHLQSKDDFIAGTFAARLLNRRVLWSDYADLKHIFTNHQVWYKNPVGKMVYFAAILAEVIIVVSEKDKELISQHIPNGKITDKMRVIYNGAFDDYTPATKHDTFTIISSSRIVTDKGIGELIDAFNMFNEQHPNTKLQILGDGPEREMFENKAASNPAITFHGYKDDPLKLVSKAHIFVLPTYHEGFSIALVEACMLGMPIIATNVGGNPEIIKDSLNGLLVGVKDSQSLYLAMEKLYTDTTLRNTLGNQARSDYTEHFNFDTIIKQSFIPLYKGRK